jgi:outer membrane protein assembly factor BamB
MLPGLGRSIVSLALIAVVGGLGSVPADAAAASPRSGGPASWTTYHYDPAGTGAVGRQPGAVDTSASAWVSPGLDGQLYGEPLVYGGRVYVATENDTVYALSAANGTVAWSAHLGAPVPASALPCGNISPTVGITSTPVIDSSRGEIFAVADVLTDGKSAHVLFGLGLDSGKVELSQDVDPPGADPVALLQRTGLVLDGGHVVFGFGGNYGDCATYRGRVVAVPEAGGTPRFFTVDAAPGESQGSVWMGGAAPVVDTHGDIWVSTGNGSVDSGSHAYDDSDGLLELSSSLRLLQYFAPSTWPANNAGDLDMSMAPVLLPDGQVVLAGKSRIVYLLDGTHLGGIGGQQAILAGSVASGGIGTVCGNDIDGGAAVVGMTVYLPCTSGIVAVRPAQSPPALRLLWTSGDGGGPPIVAAGLVWTIGQNGVLYGLNPGTGQVQQQATVGAPANHFPTPSVADGLLLATSAANVVAFAVTAGGAPVASTTPSTTPSTAPSTSPAGKTSTASSAAQGSGTPRGVIAGIVLAGFMVVAGFVWLLLITLRRRRGL